jgi:hypothetical protein
MNERDSEVLQDICDYLHGERQQQNNEYLREIKGLIYFWKTDNETYNALSKILVELESARRERNYQLFFLGLIMISVAKTAWG